MPISLDVQFKRFLETKKFEPEGLESRKKVLSKIDCHAVKTVREGTRALNPGYEAPLLWMKETTEIRTSNGGKIVQHIEIKDDSVWEKIEFD